MENDAGGDFKAHTIISQIVEKCNRIDTMVRKKRVEERVCTRGGAPFLWNTCKVLRRAQGSPPG